MTSGSANRVTGTWQPPRGRPGSVRAADRASTRPWSAARRRHRGSRGRDRRTTSRARAPTVMTSSLSATPLRTRVNKRYLTFRKNNFCRFLRFNALRIFFEYFNDLLFRNKTLVLMSLRSSIFDTPYRSKCHVGRYRIVDFQTLNFRIWLTGSCSLYVGLTYTPAVNRDAVVDTR